MRLNELKQAIKSTQQAVKMYHWYTGEWSTHKLLDKLFEFLLEAEDRVAEAALARGEPVTNEFTPITVEGLIDDPELQVKIQEMMTVILDALSMLEEYDPGIDNMTGDLIEKIIWWKNYALQKVK